MDGGALLYEKYRKYIYHTGGIAGDQPTLKQNEILAVLEKGEAVLDAKKEAGLYRIIDFTTALSDKLSKLLTLTDMSRMFGQMQGDVTKAASAFAPINNTQIPSVSFGDVIIYGANEETVEKHREINRQFTNDVIKQLNTNVNGAEGASVSLPRYFMKGDGCGKPCLTVMSLLLTESPLRCMGLWSMTLVAEVKAM